MMDSSRGRLFRMSVRLSANKVVQIKQIMSLPKRNVDAVKHNQRNVEAFYNIKKTYRHYSQTKTSPIANTYEPLSSKKVERRETEEEGAENEKECLVVEQMMRKGGDSVQLKRKEVSAVDQIYNTKKNAYKNYIKEIYMKINQELKKKNTYFTLVTQNVKQINYTDALITKQVKPIAKRGEDADTTSLRRKLKEKLKLQRLQQQSSSLQKIKQRLFIIKKSNQKKLLEIKTANQFRSARFKNNTMYLQRKVRQQMQCTLKIQRLVERREEGEEIRLSSEEKKKGKTFSLNVAFNANKISPEDYIPARKIINKKDPFVCGLRGEKQSTQEKNRERILYYIDFLWKINYANCLYVKPPSEQAIYKAYIGPGNNSLMVKSILKRRFWWTIVDKSEPCNFVWTQLKQNAVFREMQEGSATRKDDVYAFNSAIYLKELRLKKKDEEFVAQTFQSKIFNEIDNTFWLQHLQRSGKTESTINEKTYMKRAGLLSKKNLRVIEDSRRLVVHNHLEHNYFIGNKKALFYHMKKYYELKELNLSDALPLTFHIIKGVEDPEYRQFLRKYEQLEALKKSKGEEKNIWIVKPGQFSNRGTGISVCHSLDDIHIRLKSKQRSSDGNLRTFIIQKYIEKPLLFKGRKFDIRHYLLITCINGCFKAYWYPEGYIRTSSSAFTLKRGGDLFVHLTNDAIQKNSEEYGKYEKGNKISYQKFQAHLDKHSKKKSQKNIFLGRILPQMKELTLNAVRATYLALDEKRREHNFQLLGMDFMIDENYKPYLIEINTNPCLQLSCPLLARLLPAVIENAFKICVDSLFPPPEEWSSSKKNFLSDNSLQENRFQLIFDEVTEGRELQRLFHGDYKLSTSIGKIEEDAEVYENDGSEQWQGEALKKEQ